MLYRGLQAFFASVQLAKEQEAAVLVMCKQSKVCLNLCGEESLLHCQWQPCPCHVVKHAMCMTWIVLTWATEPFKIWSSNDERMLFLLSPAATGMHVQQMCYLHAEAWPDQGLCENCNGKVLSMYA